MENKDGYELDPLLETVLEEQMIEGGVPESEVDPSIEDVEEAMDERLKEKKGNQEYDAEAYASVPEEFNQKLIELMGHMRAAGVPQETIMNEIKDLIDIYVNSNPNNTQTNNQVNNMDNNFEVGRSSIPDEHLSSAFTPEELNSKLSDWNDEYSEEELNAIDNPAQPPAAESVSDYLSNYNVEGTEFNNHILEAIFALNKDDVEGAAAHLRILTEIFQNLLGQLDGGRTAKTAASEPLGLANSGWSLSDYQWGSQSNRPDYLEYVLLEHPTQGWIQANGIDIDYDGGTVNFSTETHGLPSGPYERLTEVDRGDTQASFKEVYYFTPENDTDVPDATYSAQNAPSDIVDIVNSSIAEDPSINETLDDYLAQNPPEPDWDSMPGGADW